MHRRRFLNNCAFGIGLGALTRFAGAAVTDEETPAVATSTTSDWPMFRGNSLSQGYTDTPLAKKLTLRWKYRVPDGAFEGTAAIVDGIAYVGDLDGLILALDLESGEEKWKVKKAELGYVASITVGKGKLYVGNIDGEFFCLDLQGNERWKFTTDVEISSSANFYKDNVLVGTQAGELFCLTADQGEVVWKYQIQDQIRCSPTVVENRDFLAGCDGALHIVDLDKGESIVSVPIDSPTGATPAVYGDRAFFGTEAGEVLCVDWKQAKVVWRFADPKRSQALRGSAAVSKDIVIVGSRSKRVYGLNPQDGTPIWTFVGKAGFDSSPVIVGDRVFVASTRGRILELDAKSGKKQWEAEAGGGFIGSPAVAQERLVIASDDGLVYCYG